MADYTTLFNPQSSAYDQVMEALLSQAQAQQQPSASQQALDKFASSIVNPQEPNALDATLEILKGWGGLVPIYPMIEEGSVTQGLGKWGRNWKDAVMGVPTVVDTAMNYAIPATARTVENVQAGYEGRKSGADMYKYPTIEAAANNNQFTSTLYNDTVDYWKDNMPAAISTEDRHPNIPEKEKKELKGVSTAVIKQAVDSGETPLPTVTDKDGKDKKLSFQDYVNKIDEEYDLVTIGASLLASQGNGKGLFSNLGTAVLQGRQYVENTREKAAKLALEAAKLQAKSLGKAPAYKPPAEAQIKSAANQLAIYGGADVDNERVQATAEPWANSVQKIRAAMPNLPLSELNKLVIYDLFGKKLAPGESAEKFMRDYFDDPYFWSKNRVFNEYTGMSVPRQ